MKPEFFQLIEKITKSYKMFLQKLNLKSKTLLILEIFKLKIYLFVILVKNVSTFQPLLALLSGRVVNA